MSVIKFLVLNSETYRYHNFRDAFSKCYRRHYELVSKCKIGLKTLLRQGISEPEVYGDLVNKFKKCEKADTF